MTLIGAIPSGSEKSATEIPVRLGTPGLIDDQLRAGHRSAASASACRTRFLVVRQTGEFRRRGDDDSSSGLQERLLAPSRPDMRQVQHQQRGAALRGLDDLREGVGVEIVDPVQRRRHAARSDRSLGALREQAVEIDLVDAFSEKTASAMPCAGSWSKLMVGRTEGEIEISHDDFELKRPTYGPRDIAGDRRGADTPLGADEGDRAGRSDRPRDRRRCA